MKQIFLFTLIFFAMNAKGQPSLSSFNTTQRSQLAAYIDWANASLREKDRLHDQQAKRDSINYVALQLQVNNIDKAYKKALADSMATLLPSAPIIARIDSAATAIKDLRVYVDAEIKKLQDAGKLTDAQVASIKLWMDKNFKF